MFWLADYLCWFIEPECKSAKARDYRVKHHFTIFLAGLLKCVGVKKVSFSSSILTSENVISFLLLRYITYKTIIIHENTENYLWWTMGHRACFNHAVEIIILFISSYSNFLFLFFFFFNYSSSYIHFIILLLLFCFPSVFLLCKLMLSCVSKCKQYCPSG